MFQLYKQLPQHNVSSSSHSKFDIFGKEARVFQQLIKFLICRQYNIFLNLHYIINN